MKVDKRFLLAACLLGLAVAAFLSLVEFVPVSQPAGWSATALSNPYLAAGELLKLRGYKVYYQPGFTTAPHQPGVLLLNQAPGSLSMNEQQKLRSWISEGNLLLLSAEGIPVTKAGPQDLILKPLGVRILKGDSPPPLPASLTAPLPSAYKTTPWFSWIEVSPGEGYLQIHFDPLISLLDPEQKSQSRLEDTQGIHALKYPLGHGHVVLFSDTKWLQSRWISQGDHAALWLRLMEWPSGVGQVTLTYDGSYPGLFTLIWTHARLLVISLGLLTVGCIWLVSRRFGPLLPALAAPRRRLGEHLLATGRYLWFAGRHDRLYQAARQGCRQRLLRSHSGWQHLDDPALIRELSQQTGMTPNILEQALLAEPSHELSRFLQDMRVIHQLRKLT